MLHPISQSVSIFAPATIANLTLGFDVLGLAIESPGDTVTARAVEQPGLRITRIEGTTALSTDPSQNTAGIAALGVLHRAGMDINRIGIELELVKGLPIGSGLGSSAASAAAAAFAVNILIGSPLRRPELVEPCMDAEAAVAGRHADNVAPALLGGLILVRSTEPLDLVRLPVPEGLSIVVVTPQFELLTKESRAVLPKIVKLEEMVRRTADIAAFTSACYSGDLSLLARCLSDDVITQARSPLIPGSREVMNAAIEAGALGSGISGAGPSLFAMCRSRRSAEEIVQAMKAAFKDAELDSTSVISRADCAGARRV